MAKHRKTNLLRESRNPLPLREETDWFQARVLEWAAENGRAFPWRHTTDEYRIVVTEILLQQTTAAAVAGIYDEFFTALPTWTDLDGVSIGDLSELIARLGLRNQRSVRLKSLSAWVIINGGRLPATREELEQVPGIGQYVASALLAVKYGLPEPLLDVNMARVLERFFGVRELADIRDDPWLQQVSRLAAPGVEAGWAVLDLASCTCTSQRPQCGQCHLRERCHACV